MVKPPSVLALMAAAALLAGCAGSPADQPAAQPASTASATASPTPSPVASVTASSEAGPAPTQEDAAPVETPPAVIETPVEPPAPEPVVEAPAPAPIVVGTATTWEAAPRITVTQGSTFVLTGTGYQPGQNISMFMGIYQTDMTEIDEQSMIADASGSFSFTITLAPDVTPTTYGVSTLVRDGMRPEDIEASKQHALVDVLPA
ncbi:hypothetical protein ACX80U_15275 [Arthrobacter sp. TmT3-37]